MVSVFAKNKKKKKKVKSSLMKKFKHSIVEIHVVTTQHPLLIALLRMFDTH